MIYISDMNLNNHRSITLLIISHLIISNLLSFLLAKRISPNAKIGFFFFFIYKQKIFMITSSLCAQKQCYKT